MTNSEDTCFLETESNTKQVVSLQEYQSSDLTTTRTPILIPCHPIQLLAKPNALTSCLIYISRYRG